MLREIEGDSEVSWERDCGVKKGSGNQRRIIWWGISDVWVALWVAPLDVTTNTLGSTPQHQEVTSWHRCE